jgi:hypothetical protein
MLLRRVSDGGRSARQGQFAGADCRWDIGGIDGGRKEWDGNDF